MRIHGNGTETELWKFGPVVEAAGRKMLGLRYRLMPYIYSQAWQIAKNGASFLRPLVMDFPRDQKVADLKYQYMFGNAFLVAPVMHPKVRSLSVYLPSGISWYNFWTGELHSGGETISTNAALETLPLFIKSGSVIPLGPEMQYATESKGETLRIQIYPGANGAFELYEDESTNTNYERGRYSIIPFTWDDSKKSLLIGKRNGEFEGMLRVRNFIIVDPSGKELKRLRYKGKAIKEKLFETF
jgi:alpha-D-xyloside xylohydrolase